MLKAISSYVQVKERLHPGMLDAYARMGAQAIEIFAARGHFDYTNRQHVRETANWFKTSGVPLSSLHAPMFADSDWGRDGTPPLNIASLDKKARILAMDEIKRAIEVAEQIPFRFLIQHIGLPNESFSEHKFFDAATASIEHLHAFAKPLGVRVLLENIPNELSTPERLHELVTTAHFDDIGFCFDIGHAHIEQGVEAAFAVMKDRIRSTHIHDNDKQRDAHLWPGDGSIDWNEAMKLLRSAPLVPPLVFEIEAETAGNLEEKFGEVARKLEGAGASA
ncbi:Xylose isomerase-like TIM barrel [Candidatus Koribacter versatilis Ellin345]|uniref:Xylose isomerase-like TIM barrel n=1 Tax=Koribacter versatilis (strain Ellin345) TaxID=204669 RepID=Q1IHQ2_KORVE|nr:sugar phosphate isomerase/epimerase family protein [Candidatus Koribacter versatilis]ABF43598.1 Xylose isomerase-like TIM barrel [Candidatus Koribacter versatilis Ellin345]